MILVVAIQRFQPERPEASGRQEFEVEAGPGERLLDVLVRIQRGLDPTFVFRRSCGHGVCGSDAMIINGRERLACQTLVKDVAAEGGEAVTVEPLRNLRVVRDLVVAEEPFFERYRAVRPFPIDPVAGEGDRERRQTPEERSLIDDATNCILCAACFSACPVVAGVNPGFIGPAAVIQAGRFQDDSRDRGFAERLAALDRPEGVWACENRFACTRVCPRGIPVTKLINMAKRRIAGFKKGADRPRS